MAAIVDNGHGMSVDEFTERWLVVGTESKAAARETILDFSFPELNDAYVKVGRLLAEGKELIDKQIEAQQEQLDAMAQVEE
jgi:hypothetical protein